MNSTEMMRREILRLAGATSRSAFISVRRISAFYNVPEKAVRSELTKLADENRIRLAGWDGIAGRIVQAAAPEQLVHSPADPFVSEFINAQLRFIVGAVPSGGTATQNTPPPPASPPLSTAEEGR